MRVLLDECVPRRPKRELPDFDVWTVQDMGSAGVKNGDLLQLAAPHFDAFLSVDRGLAYQQNLAALTIGVVIIHAPSNDIDDIRPFLPAAQMALRRVRQGECVRVEHR